mgnify:CR=1 FL=1
MSTLSSLFERSLAPPRIRSPEEARRARLDAMNRGFGQVMGAAFRNENLIFTMARMAERGRVPFDPDDRGLFADDPETFDELTKGLPAMYWDKINEGRSVAERQIIARQMRKIFADEQVLEQAGFSGLGARMLAAVLDPYAIAIGTVTGGGGAAAAKARSIGLLVRSTSQVTRRQAIVRAGLVGGATEASIEATLASENPTKGVADIIVAGATAGIIAGGFTTLLTRGMSDTKRMVDYAEAKQMAAEDPTVDLTAKADEIADRHFRAKPLRDIAERENFDADEVAQMEAFIEADEFDEAYQYASERIPDPNDAFAFARQQGMTDVEALDEAKRIDALVEEIKAARSQIRMEATPEEVAGEGVPAFGENTVFHGTRSGELESFLDEQGNLVLRASENFEGRQVGVSFSPSRDTALDFATRTTAREGAVAAQRQQGGFVFEIDRNAIPDELVQEAGDELATQGATEVVIPAGRFHAVPVSEATQRAVSEFGTAGQQAARRMTNRELGAALLRRAIRAEVREQELVQEAGATTARDLAIRERFGDEALDEPFDPFLTQELGRRAAESEDVEQLVAELAAGADELSTLQRAWPFLDPDMQSFFRDFIARTPQPSAPRAAAPQTNQVTFRNAFGEDEVGTVIGREGDYFIVRDTDGFEVTVLPEATRIPTQPELDVAARRMELNRMLSREEMARQEQVGEFVTQPAEPELPPPPPKRFNDFWIWEKSTDALSHFGFDIAAGLGKSASSMMRRAASVMMQDALPKIGGVVQAIAASEWVTRTSNIFRGAINESLLKEFKGFAKQSGVLLRGRLALQDDFLEDVGKAIRGAAQKFPGNEFVERAADRTRKVFAEVLEMAQRHGVRGLEFALTDPNYLPRIWKVSAIEAMIRKGGENGQKNVEDLFAKALMQGHADDGLDEELAAKWSKAMLRILRNTDDYSDLERSQLFNGENLEFLRRVLLEEGSGVSPQQAEDIVQVIQGTLGRPPRPLTIRANKRAKMDEGMELPTDAGILKLSDLMENNVHELMEIYTKQMTGAMAMTEVFKEMSRATERAINDFAGLRRALIGDMKASGMNDLQIGRDLGKLETVHKSIIGQRLHQDNHAWRFMRGLRLYSHIAGSGQFGIAQVPELGLAMGSVGIRAMLKQMPALRAIVDSARTGELNNQLALEMRIIAGLGLGRRNDSIISRFDTAEMINEAGGGTAERWLRRGSRFANDISGMAPFHVFQQLSISVLAAQKMASIAKAGRKLSKSRMADLGLDDKMAEKVMKTLKDKATFAEGVDGGRLLETNVAKWEDAEVAAAFVGSIQRWSSIMVQENDIGNLAKWMTHPIGQMLFQFRAFPFVAMRKQLYRRFIQLGDRQQAPAVIAEVGTSLLFASLAYVGQQHLLSVGMGEKRRKEFLEERLADNNWIFAAVQRSGVASFVPDVTDSVVHMSGGQPIFNFRNSGLGTINTVSAALSNPSFNLFDKSKASVREIAQAVRGDEPFSDVDVKRLTLTLPYGRNMVVANTFSAVAGLFPEE